MFAVLHLPQFSLQAALRHEPELWSRPVALVDPQQNTPRVMALTVAASEAGVEWNQTPTQALARCREVLIRHRSLRQEEVATQAVLQVAEAFSPNLETTAPGIVTLDLRGLLTLKDALPETLAQWAGQLRESIRQLNLRARIGVGPTPNVARHAAEWTETIQIVGD